MLWEVFIGMSTRNEVSTLLLEGAEVGAVWRMEDEEVGLNPPPPPPPVGPDPPPGPPVPELKKLNPVPLPPKLPKPPKSVVRGRL